MLNFIYFIFGAIVGGAIGVIVMCVLAVTGKSEAPPRSEKKRTKKHMDSNS